MSSVGWLVKLLDKGESLIVKEIRELAELRRLRRQEKNVRACKKNSSTGRGSSESVFI